ncbi:MAG: hypothetical protein ACC619_03595 [Paracoccaceae bacterium]
MKKFVAGLIALTVLAACGVDGAPLTPNFSGQTTIGVNSNTGAFSSTQLGVSFGG